MRLLNPLLLIALIFLARSEHEALVNVSVFVSGVVSVALMFITTREARRLLHSDPPLDWRFVDAMKAYYLDWHNMMLSRVLRFVLTLVLAIGGNYISAFLVLLSAVVRIGFDRHLNDFFDTPREARGPRKGFKSGDEK